MADRITYKSLGYDSYLLRTIKTTPFGIPEKKLADTIQSFSDLGFDYSLNHKELVLPKFSSLETKNLFPENSLSYSQLTEYIGQDYQAWKYIDDEVGTAGTTETSWLSPTNNYSGNFNNPSNGYSDDGNLASTNDTLYGNAAIKYYGFDVSSIPSGATINGIQLKVDCYRDNNLYLPQTTLSFAINYPTNQTYSNNYSLVYLNKDWPIVEDTITLGDSSDVWGNADISLANIQKTYFGVEIQCYMYYPAVTYFIDWVRIKIYYTPA